MWTLPRPVLVLEVQLKERTIGRYGFTKRVVNVGRDRTSDLRLDHPGISRAHFRVRREGTLYVLEDCLSANGTFVNGRRVSSHVLGDGDVVEVGKYVLKISQRELSEYDGADPDADEKVGAIAMPTVRAPHLRADAVPPDDE